MKMKSKRSRTEKGEMRKKKGGRRKEKRQKSMKNKRKETTKRRKEGRTRTRGTASESRYDLYQLGKSPKLTIRSWSPDERSVLFADGPLFFLSVTPGATRRKRRFWIGRGFAANLGPRVAHRWHAQCYQAQTTVSRRDRGVQGC